MGGPGGAGDDHLSDDEETVEGRGGARGVVAFGAAVLAALGTAPSAEAQAPAEWPQFRGLTAGAVADDPALPDTWSRTENVAWSVEIPGLGLELAGGGGRPRLS